MLMYTLNLSFSSKVIKTILVDLVHDMFGLFVTGQNGFLFMVNDSTIKNLFSLGFKMMIYLILERYGTY